MSAATRRPLGVALALLAVLSLTVFSLSFLSIAGAQSTAAATDAAEPVVEVLTQTTQSWNGAVLPAYPEGQPEVRLLRITVPAGYRLGTHLHPVINVGYMLSGTLTVVTESGDRNVLEAGDTIVEVVDTWHYGVNDGDEPVEILVFYAGTTELPITVQEEP